MKDLTPNDLHLFVDLKEIEGERRCFRLMKQSVY